MITSITSATVAATSAVAGWGVALGAGGAIGVISLLLLLEVMGTGTSRFQSTLRSTLRIAVSPLLIVFGVSVAVKAFTVLAS